MNPNVKTIADGAVSGRKEVTLPLTKEQAAELRNALAVVTKYEKVALGLAGVSLAASDWVMVGYDVKDDKVIVDVRDGACG